MESIIIYILKNALSLSFFYLLYMFCLRGDTFLGLKRFYFLFTVVFSLIFPFFSFELSSQEILVLPISLDTIIITSSPGNIADLENFQTIGFIEILLFFIFIVTIGLLFRFFSQLYLIFKLKNNNKIETFRGYKIIRISDEKGSSFSFFKWIFLNVGEKSHENIDEIIMHEKTHVNQWHTIDLIICELMCILFWWNPFVWLLKREVKTNLEYLADRGVLKAGVNLRDYQYTLLRITCQNTGIPIISNFNVSELKKRITMMNKKKTSFFSYTKYLLVLPMISVLLLANCSTSPENENDYLASTVQISYEKLDKESEDLVFTTVEKMPSFQGGEGAMIEYIQKNLKYPLKAMEDNVQGKVMIRFVIEKNGEIRDAEILEGISSECDNEALRVVKEMPKWKPGMQNGEAVAVFFTLPIVYKLTDGNDDPKKFDSEKCLILIDNKISTKKELDKLDNSKIESVSVFRGNDFVDFAKTHGYQTKGKDNALVITLKK